jgi:hypothetical protein
MLQVTRIWRRIEVTEDADLPCELSVPTEEYEDAWDHLVPLENTWPRWVCECGTHNEGCEAACIYCGTVREDFDALG